MDMLLSLFREVLPKRALVPNSYYEAKKVIQELSLDYNKIYAGKDDCVLFWREHANLQSCLKCNMPRWKTDGQKGEKVAYKVL